MRAFRREHPWAGVRTLAGGALVAAGLALATTPAGATTVTLTTCSSSQFISAAGSSGTITFDISSSCTITLPSPISIPPSVKLTIDDSGEVRRMIISGGETSQLFKVSGGTLSISDITLSGGFVRKGPSADGHNGVDAVPGTNGTSPGGNGGKGKAATAGTAGKPGKSVDGGALDITSGTVTLNSDSLVNDEAVGGSGGQGGWAVSGRPAEPAPAEPRAPRAETVERAASPAMAVKAEPVATPSVEPSTTPGASPSPAPRSRTTSPTAAAAVLALPRGTAVSVGQVPRGGPDRPGRPGGQAAVGDRDGWGHGRRSGSRRDRRGGRRLQHGDPDGERHLNVRVVGGREEDPVVAAAQEESAVRAGSGVKEASAALGWSAQARRTALEEMVAPAVTVARRARRAPLARASTRYREEPEGIGAGGALYLKGTATVSGTSFTGDSAEGGIGGNGGNGYPGSGGGPNGGPGGGGGNGGPGGPGGEGKVPPGQEGTGGSSTWRQSARAACPGQRGAPADPVVRVRVAASPTTGTCP